jgi:hypothetical protein
VSQRGYQAADPVGGHEAVGQGAGDRVPRADGLRCQREVGAEFARRAGEQPGTAHIRRETDAHLWHRDL